MKENWNLISWSQVLPSESFSMMQWWPETSRFSAKHRSASIKINIIICYNFHYKIFFISKLLQLLLIIISTHDSNDNSIKKLGSQKFKLWISKALPSSNVINLGSIDANRKTKSSCQKATKNGAIKAVPFNRQPKFTKFLLLVK